MFEIVKIYRLCATQLSKSILEAALVLFLKGSTNNEK